MKWILIFRDFQWFIPKKITIIYYYILYIIHIFIQQLKDMNCCFGNDNSQTKKKSNKMYLKKILWFFSICRNALVILFTSTIAFYFEKIGSSPFILSGLFLLYFIEICIKNSYNELFFVINFFFLIWRKNTIWTSQFFFTSIFISYWKWNLYFLANDFSHRIGNNCIAFGISAGKCSYC